MLGGAVMDAQAIILPSSLPVRHTDCSSLQVFAEADLYAGLSINGSVSSTVSLSYMRNEDLHYSRSACRPQLKFVSIRYVTKLHLVEDLSY